MSRAMNTSRGVLGFGALVILASAACGGDDGSSSAPSGNNDDAGTGADSTTETSTSPPGTPPPTPTPTPGALVVGVLSSPNVSEHGTKSTFTVKLADKPTHDVTIRISVDRADEVSLDVTLLKFTPSNFDATQTVTITGKDDSIADGDAKVLVSFGESVSSDPRYDRKTAAPFAVTNADDDVPGIFVSSPSGTSTTETGGSVTVNVHLRTRPAGSVYVPIASSNSAEGKASPAGLLFTAANYFIDQVVTITGQADAVKDSDQEYEVAFGKTVAPDDAAYRALDAKVTLTNKNESVVELATNWGAACVRTTSGRIQCWGRNDQGALGLGDSSSRGDQPGELGAALPLVNLGTERTAKRLFGAMNTESAFCVVRDDDKLVCWGSNPNATFGSGSLGNVGFTAASMGDGLVPASFGAGRTIKQFTLGYFGSCAILDNDALKCWGYNGWGNLGYGDTAARQSNATLGDNLAVVDVGSGRTAKQIAIGHHHTCGLLDDGTVKCWGLNDVGQLGYGDTVMRGDNANETGDNLPIVDLGTGRTAKQIVAGHRHSCALLDDNTVKCWGINNAGQLGLGDTANRGDAANEMGDNLAAVPIGTGRTIKSLGAGWEHNCVILDDDTVKCWGRNAESELGSGDSVTRGDGPNEMGDNIPVVRLGTGRTVVQLATMTRGACALLDNGWVKCWGHNNWGISGTGNTNRLGDNAYEMGDAFPRVPLLW
jgi:alpha-tubulin suppressor-like RCC1 family protein